MDLDDYVGQRTNAVSVVVVSGFAVGWHSLIPDFSSNAPASSASETLAISPDKLREVLTNEPLKKEESQPESQSCTKGISPCGANVALLRKSLQPSLQSCHVRVPVIVHP